MAVGAVAVISALRASDDGDNSATVTAPPGKVSTPGVAQPGSKAPDFDLPGIDGGRVRLADYAGRPVVLNFWASWCFPCRKEFPELRRIAADYRDDGLAVIGVTFRDIDADSRRFVESMDATWPQASGGRGDPVAGEYGVISPPQTFFIAPDGTIAARSYGALSNRELRRQVDRLLQSSQVK